MAKYTKYGTVRKWLSQGEKLGIRIERELGIALRENPQELRKLGKFQKGHGVIAWIAYTEHGEEVHGEQSIGETLRAKVLTALRPRSFNYSGYIDVVGD